ARPVVRRPRQEREPELASIRTEEDPNSELEARVQELMSGGAAGLAEITERITAELPAEERYVVAGRVAELVARLGNTESARERPWVPVAETFVVEEWSLESGSEER
ncbi:MAG TPA: condensin subunit MukF, partial [Polyangiaceae bacterium]